MFWFLTEWGGIGVLATCDMVSYEYRVFSSS